MNFKEIIERHLSSSPDKIIYTFTTDDNINGVNLTIREIHAKSLRIATQLTRRLKPGSRAILIFEPGPDFIVSFLGCLYSGTVAVPVMPPAGRKLKNALHHIIRDSEPAICLTNNLTFNLMELAGDLLSTTKNGVCIGATPVFNTDSLEETPETCALIPSPSMESIAFLQYTSGSTGNPKGVMVTHRNLLSNVALIKDAFGHTQSLTGVGWLPAYHDMGLIGNILHMIWLGAHLVAMSPLDFIKNPLRWLELISHYKASSSGGPNFAYELCIRHATPDRIKNIDLSSWELAFCGAEPVRPETIERFFDTFRSCGFNKEAFYGCYGLAENTLIVTGSKKMNGVSYLPVNKDALQANLIIPGNQSSGNDTQRLAGSGFVAGTQKLKIVDPETCQPCAGNQTGEIWVQGDSVAKGYWKKPELTKEVFQATLRSGEGPFLRTGDLGYMDESGELFVTGRIKDLIIINGKNYYPQDIEELLKSCSEKIRSGRSAAFAVEKESQENLCIVAEFRGDAEDAEPVFKAIRNTVSREFGITCEAISLVVPGTLPITTSGKIKRKAIKELFLNNRLDRINAFERKRKYPIAGKEDNLISGLKDILSDQLGIDPDKIDIEAPFGQYGLSSLDAAEMTAQIKALTGTQYQPSVFYENPTIKSLAAFLAGSEIKSLFHLKDKKSEATEPVAVIGLGCNLPGSPDKESFWENLVNEKDLISEIPENRHDLQNRSNKNKGVHCRWGGFIDGIETFDAPFFGISATEAKMMDPQHRKFIEVAWHTVEDAGYNPQSLSGKSVGVFVGASSFDYSELALKSPDRSNAYAATGVAHSILSNRLSYIFNIHGPSETIDTACSSSLIAIHRATQAIRAGECEQAIAGGVNALLSFTGFDVLTKAGILSEDGRCKTFDQSANGYVRGEGAGAVLLKPLSAAIRDNDHIYAVIRSSAVNHGGKTESLTAPNENAQASLLVDAWDQTDIDPESISYIETHGTGTALGDPIEINGLKKAFSELYNRKGTTGKKAYCGIGAVKTNIGHLEAAAGIAGFIKVVLSLKNRKLPATLHQKEQNPLIDLAESPFYIVKKTIDMTPVSDSSGNTPPLRAGVSSFGFGGAYAHVVVEEYVEKPRPLIENETPVLITLSAKTREGLHEYAKGLYYHLEKTPAHSLKDVAFTLTKGRRPMKERIAFVAENRNHLNATLKQIGLEGNLPETVYAGSTSGSDHHLSEQVPDGLQMAQSVSELKTVAKDWVAGSAGVGEASSETHVKRVALPTTPFEKKKYWIIETPQNRDLSEDSDKTDTESPETESLTKEVVIDWFTRKVADILEISEAEVDSEIPFDEYGIDSVALISFLSDFEEDFGKEIPEAAIRECPDIISFVDFIIEGKESETIDLYAEAVLDGSIQFDHCTERGENEYGKKILLTGSTGFFGVFLLRELLLKTEADIFCLVRAEDKTSGLERIQSVTDRFLISDAPLNNRIHIIPGDLREPKLGMADDDYRRIAEEVDTIFHCGAMVDWMKPYRALKTANVDGTTEVLKLAGTSCLKRVHHISSLAVLPLVDDKPVWYEEDLGEPDKLIGGYGQTKWVAEKLCRQARERGLPVSIYRFDYVAGATSTGAMKETDFLVRLVKGVAQLGYVPMEETNFDILGVDYLSNVVVTISKHADNQNKTYHLINRRPFSTSDFTDLIRRSGYTARRISFNTWKKLVESNASSDLFPLYPFIKQYDRSQFELFGSWLIDNTNTLTALFKTDPELIESTPSADEVMSGAIRFFQESGHLPCPDFRPVLDIQQRYWDKKLEGAVVPLELPFGKPGSDGKNEAFKRFRFSGETEAKLRDMCIRENVDISEVLLTTFKLLLLKYTGETDISIGTHLPVPLSRNTEITASTAPVIRTELNLSASFRTALYLVRQSVSEAIPNTDLPDNAILKSFSGGEADRYDMMFIYSSSEKRETDRMNIYPCSIDEALDRKSAFTLIIENSDIGLSGKFRFDPDRFSEKEIAETGKHFIKLLESVSEKPETALDAFSLLTPDETAEVLNYQNDTEVQYPDPKTLPELYALQRAKTPDLPAVIMEEKRLSYTELDELSGKIAAALIKSGVKPNDIVAVCSERSPELVASLYGIQRAGAAYLPLDPDHPEDRLSFILKDAEVSTLMVQKQFTVRFTGFEGETIIIDDESADFLKETPVSAPFPAQPDDLAYVIYTSGSTGMPKGCMISHRAICNRILWMQEEYRLTETDRVLQKTPYTFDVSVWEFFWPLMTGASLVLAKPEGHKDPDYLTNLIDSEKITVCHFVPSMLRLFLEETTPESCSSLTRLFTSGEALPYELMAGVLSAFNAELHNLYGPTEAAVDVTFWSCTLRGDKTVPIGKPIANTRIHILDKSGRPVPFGHSGELHIGGTNLAKGYLNRHDLTEKKFIPDPFSNDPGARLYKTGDLARYMPDGNIEYLGRLDFQVKLRGLRIELEEIENRIREYDGISDTIVLMREDTPNDQRIAAYLILTETTDTLNLQDLKSHLGKTLPAYMIPVDYVVLDEFPLTSSGKTNRKELPKPEKRSAGSDMTQPATPMEVQLFSIWKEVLETEDFGIHDHFIDIGGNSLLAMKLMVDINRVFEIELTIQTLFNNLTIAELAETIENIHQGNTVERQLTLEDFMNDSIPDPVITSADHSVICDTATPPEHILLTGSTGFLGVYLLYSLLKKTTAEIYCLVRAKNDWQGAERIRKSMEDFGLWESAFISRIVPVTGDLSSPALGISDEKAEFLAETIDTIYHNGSLVNFSYPYSFLKRPNVDGTMELLKLTVQKKTKKLIYISSTSVFETSEYGKGHVVYETDELPDPQGLFYGYSQSKWVAEKLVAEAAKTGVPAMIFRPSTIYGDSRTGASNLYDILNFMLLACAKAEAFPLLDFHLDGSPVDHVADTIVNVSLHEDAFGKTFHIVNPKKVEIVDAFEYVKTWGFDFPTMEREAWVERLLQSVGDNKQLQSFVPVLKNEVSLMNGKTYFEMQSESLPEFSMENTTRFSGETVSTCPEIDEKLCHKYLDYLRKIDFL